LAFFADNGTGVDVKTGTNGCRPMLSVQTEYPTLGVSVGMHPLFHQYAENYYV